MKKFFKFGCLSMVGIVALFIVIGLFASSGEDTTETTSGDGQTEEKASGDSEDKKKEEKKEEPKEKVYGIGDKATVAKVDFTVNSVKTKQSFDDITGKVTPSGKFVVVDITIKNGQKEALSISDSFFEIKKKDGTTYEPSSDAMFAIPAEKQFFLEQINPGIKKSGMVVFDVPKSLKIKNTKLFCKTGFWGTETIEINLK